MLLTAKLSLAAYDRNYRLGNDQSHGGKADDHDAERAEISMGKRHGGCLRFGWVMRARSCRGGRVTSGSSCSSETTAVTVMATSETFSPVWGWNESAMQECSAMIADELLGAVA